MRKWRQLFYQLLATLSIKWQSCILKALRHPLLTQKRYFFRPSHWADTNEERWQQVTESLVIRTTGFRSAGDRDFINSLASGLPVHSTQSPLQKTVCTESAVCARPGVGAEVAKADHTKQANKGAERCRGHPPLPPPPPPPPCPPHIPGEQMGVIAASNSYLKKTKRCEKAGLGRCNSWITQGQAWGKNLETGMLREPFLWKRLKRCLPPNRAPATNQTTILPSPVWESVSLLGLLTKHEWGLFIGEWVMLITPHKTSPQHERPLPTAG